MSENNKLTRSDSFSNKLTSRAGLSPTNIFDREGGKGKGGSVKTSILRSLKSPSAKDTNSLLDIVQRGTINLWKGMGGSAKVELGRFNIAGMVDFHSETGEPQYRGLPVNGIRFTKRLR
jgi:hypothetical protein